MKIYEYKNNACVIFERLPSGYYSVKLRGPSGELIDKILADTFRGASEYRRAFCAIAKKMQGAQA